MTRDSRRATRVTASLTLALVATLSFGIASTAAAQTRVIVITGLGSDPKYIEQFRTEGAAITEALHTRYGIPDADITWLGEDSTSKSPRYRGLSNRENIEKAVTAIASAAKPNEQVVMILIGH